MKQIVNQADFFKHLKAVLPEQLSLVDEIAGILNLSNDSVYRRIRGEKDLSLDELKKICESLKISLDSFLHVDSSNILFYSKYLKQETFNLRSYLNEMLETFKQFQHFKQKEIIYLTKDYPIYHYFMFPEIASFKYFFWMKTYLNFPEYAKQKFSISHLLEDIHEIGLQIARMYTEIRSIEIHNPDNILTTLRQIEYYKDSLFFESPEDIEKVYESLNKMIDHMEEQAMLGKKFMKDSTPHTGSVPFEVYVSDFFIGDNTHLVTLDGHMRCYKVHNGINYIATTDESYCAYTKQFMQTIISKSACISFVGEKERNRFFNMIRERINAYRGNRVHTLANF
jgi:transcriptional regulator with XRE-family HTH domain